MGRSVQEHILDDQVDVLFSSLELSPEMREVALQEAMREHSEIDVRALNAQRKRIARAYGDGAYSDAEYEARLREIDAQIAAAVPSDALAIVEIMRLLDDLPAVWAAARAEARRDLVAPMLDQVYVDRDSKLLVGIAPTPGFRALLQGAVRTAPGAPVELLPPRGWGVVETGEN